MQLGWWGSVQPQKVTKLNAQCLAASWRQYITKFPCPTPYLIPVCFYAHRMEPVRPCILCEAAQLHCISYKEQDRTQWNHSNPTRSCRADYGYVAMSSPTHRACRMWPCNTSPGSLASLPPPTLHLPRDQMKIPAGEQRGEMFRPLQLKYNCCGKGNTDLVL